MNLNLSPPLAYMLATEGFGMAREGRLHGGLDLRAAVGTPVRAASSGTVVYAGPYSDTTGLTVELDHGDGVITRYLHQSSLAAAKGQKVARGQLLGYTGFATSPHLHFDTWVLGSRLGEYTGKFGTATGLGTMTKSWNGQVYVKVPSEPLVPSQYQDDVIAAAKKFGVKLYSPINQFVAIALLGAGGYLLWQVVKRNTNLRLG